jgi:hypothetical protein
LLLQNKRGLSEIIGYALLIVLVVGMAATVYSFLKVYVPKEKAQCPHDVSLIIDKMTCEDKKLNITLINSGLFSVQGVYVKNGNSSRTFKTILNCPDFNNKATCVLHFGDTPENSVELKPGEIWNKLFMNETLVGMQEIEIQPLAIVDRTIAVCDKAIITQKVNCG